MKPTPVRTLAMATLGISLGLWSYVVPTLSQVFAAVAVLAYVGGSPLPDAAHGAVLGVWVTTVLAWVVVQLWHPDAREFTGREFARAFRWLQVAGATAIVGIVLGAL
jgi:hypothetical protein